MRPAKPKRTSGAWFYFFQILLFSLVSMWLGFMGGVAFNGINNTSTTQGTTSSSSNAASTASSPAAGGANLRAQGAVGVKGAKTTTAKTPSHPGLTPLGALIANTASLSPLPYERIPLVLHTAALTGHPPLVSRSDTTPQGDPDMENFGQPPQFGPPPTFVMVNPWEGSDPKATGGGADAESPAALAWKARVETINDNPFQYVVQSEDSIREVTMAMLLSPGKRRDPTTGAPSDKGALTCRASPVTRPFGCLATLRETHPHLFTPGTPAIPLPASLGGPLVVDVGFTSAGYFALLAASLGVSAMAIDTQPHCTLWGQMAGGATLKGPGAGAGAAGGRYGGSFRAFSAIPFTPGEGYEGVVSLPAPLRTGCVGTWTHGPHVSYKEVEAFYWDKRPVVGGRPVEGGGKEEEDGGRFYTEASRKFLQTEGAPKGLGGFGGGGTVDIPIAPLDDILEEEFGGGSTKQPPPTILLLKIDSRGHEVETLLGLERTLASPNPPLNVILELNKRRTAITMRLPSALAAAKAEGVTLPAIPSQKELVDGSPLHPTFVLSEADNAKVAGEWLTLGGRGFSRMFYSGTPFSYPPHPPPPPHHTYLPLLPPPPLSPPSPIRGVCVRSAAIFRAWV